jgi:hypothetical protein
MDRMPPHVVSETAQKALEHNVFASAENSAKQVELLRRIAKSVGIIAACAVICTFFVFLIMLNVGH